MAFQLDHLNYSYSGRLVLNDISCQLEGGGFYGILGPNGAGKSTLVRVLTGLLRHYGGEALFCGRAIRNYKQAELAKQIAFIPQESRLLFPFTVWEVVMMGRFPFSSGAFFETPEDAHRVEEALELTQSVALAPRRFNQLSSGERQRVLLAGAVAQQPQVLLLDEPTTYLDLKHQILMFELLGRLNQERGITVIVVTHDLNLASAYCRSWLVLKQGRLCCQGRPEEVISAELIQDVFEVDVLLQPHPQWKCPAVFVGAQRRS